MLAGLVQAPFAPGAQPQSGGRDTPRSARHRRDGRTGFYLAGGGQDGAHRSGRSARARRCGLGELCRRLRHGRARRLHRRHRWRRHRADHDRHQAAGVGRIDACRGAGRPRRQAQRLAGLAGLDGAGRRASRSHRRARLHQEPVQPRHGRQAPAGFVLQALHLSRRAGEGAHPRHDPRRFAGLDPRLAAGRTTAAPIAAPSPCSRPSPTR